MAKGKRPASKAATDSGRTARKPGTAANSTAKRKASPAAAKARPDGFPIVGIGASAGGLDALRDLFREMPEDCGLGFVVVQHMPPDHKSLLPSLLGKLAKLPVEEVTDGLRVAPNHVYVIPPGVDLGLENGTLRLSKPQEPHGYRHPIDFFFRSLAADQGENAVCIVLSGTGTEGALGLKAVKESGGVVLVQDPETAAYDAMPRHAIATDLVDLVLPPAKMAEALCNLLTRRVVPATADRAPAAPAIVRRLPEVLALLRRRTGHDLALYRQNTILRRIERRMAINQIESLDHYLRYLRATPTELNALFKDLLIRVTTFFRDPDAFAVLNEVAIPALFAQRDPERELRVWVAGCATGEEAYSVALLLRNHMDRNNLEGPVELFATDIDGAAIEAARRGVYPASIAVDVPADYLKRYFEADDGTYRIKRTVRDMVVFAQQNAIQDPPFSRLDLVTSRNLLIYLEPEWQKKLLSMFHYGLRPGGFLFLGSSETVGDLGDRFEVVDRKHKLFRRRPGGHAAATRFDVALPALADGGRVEGAGRAPVLRQVEYRTVVERMLLADYAPACVVVNGAFDIVYVHGRTGKYLEPAAGEANLNLVSMARAGLQAELTRAQAKVFGQGESFERRALRIEGDGGYRIIDLIVKPLREPPALRGLALIVFADAAAEPAPEKERTARAGSRTGRRVQELEHELQATKEYLQSTIEELQTSNEELKSANEELQSTNEELQSTNEEHETAKEELQSVNEELATVNAELERKFAELAEVNDDMANLLASTDIGTLFLDKALNIVRFTPAVTEIINLIASDAGRPVAHIVAEIEYPGFLADARDVLKTLQPREAEARTKAGRWYMVRMLPYRTRDDVINGVVITFIDVTERKALEQQSRLATVVRDSNDAVAVLDFDGKILAWNRGATEMYGIPEDTALGSGIDRIVPENLRAEYGKILAKVRAGERVVHYETARRKRDGAEIRVWLTASRLTDETGKPYAVATTERDITWLGARP